MTKLTVKGALLAVAIACTAWAGAAQAQEPMMGRHGPGYGMGPGMMGGYGFGYGMGMGPGMMGGYGPGYGMGPGMMGGCGAGYGMGPGMMGEYGLGALNLSPEQRTRLARMHEDLAQKRWALMSKMREQGYRLNLYFAGGGNEDEAAARASFEAMVKARKEMFDLSREAGKQVDAILTREQREQLRKLWNPSGAQQGGG